MAEDPWNLPRLLLGPSCEPLRCVVLLHDCPTRGTHYDWMFEAPPPERLLPSARCAARPDTLAVGSQLQADEGPDHRVDYLNAPTAPNALDGGRGVIGCVRTGQWRGGRGAVLVKWADDDGWRTHRVVSAGPKHLIVERLS